MRPETLFRVASLLTILMPVSMLAPVPADIGLTLIAVLFIAHSYLTKDWRWCREAWVGILLLLWVYMMARGLFAEKPMDALRRAAPFIRYVVFAAALARWTLADTSTRRRFTQVLLGWIMFLAFDGALQWVTGKDILLHPMDIRFYNGENHLRLVGPFARPILGIMITWFLYPALLPLLVDGTGVLTRGRRLIAAFLCLGAALIAITLSGERMALLLTLFGGFIAVCCLPLNKRIILASMAGAAALLGVIALVSPVIFKRQFTSTIETITHFNDSPYGKLLASDVALAEQHPVLGMGTGQFRYGCQALYAGNQPVIDSMCNTHPHNIYFEWLIETGAIGFLLFVALLVTVFHGALRGFTRKCRDPLFVGLLIGFGMRVWPFMATTGFFSRWGAPPFWLVLGALLVYTAREPERLQHADPSVSF